jgi:hypothetical protein
VTVASGGLQATPRTRTPGHQLPLVAGSFTATRLTPWRGTTHVVVSPLEFMQRLTALGAAAAIAPDPLSRRAGAQCQVAGAGGASGYTRAGRYVGAGLGRARLCARQPARISWARLLKRAFEIDRALL